MARSMDRFQPLSLEEEMAREKGQIMDDFGSILMSSEDVYKADLEELQNAFIALSNLLVVREQYHERLEGALKKRLDDANALNVQLLEDKRQQRRELERLYANRSTDSKNAA